MLSLRNVALILVALILTGGCARFAQAPKSVLKERIVEDSTGKYRVIICPHCGRQIKIPF